MNNSKAERFKRVASLRVQKVLDSMDNLAKCSNKANYAYDASDVRKMMNAIKRRVRLLEQLYGQEEGDRSDTKFSF